MEDCYVSQRASLQMAQALQRQLPGGSCCDPVNDPFQIVAQGQKFTGRLGQALHGLMVAVHMQISADAVRIEAQSLSPSAGLKIEAVLAVSNIKEDASISCCLGLGLDFPAGQQIVIFAMESVGDDVSLVQGIQHILNFRRHMADMYQHRLADGPG